MRVIWAIILAAGESKRMKVPKMLLPFRGKTIIETVIDNVTNSQVTDTVVVLGSGVDDILKLVERLPVKHCYNQDFKQGMLSSVQCGFRSIPSEADAILIFPGDLPKIEPGITDFIINAYLKSGNGLVLPVYNGKRGHPLLIDKKYRKDIDLLNADEGLRSLASRYADDVLEVDVKSPAVVNDIDTPEEYLSEI